MPKIEQIHFVCGLGQDAGKPLRPHELVAILCAARLHPAASVFLHTAEHSCDNYAEANAGVRRITYPSEAYNAWPGWCIERGEHMSDKLRLDVLLSPGVSNALYLDTDAFCLQSLDWLAHIEGCAMARLSPLMLTNGVIWCGTDKRFLQAWRDALANSNSPSSYLWPGCMLPSYLHGTAGCPGLTVLHESFNGATGDEAFAGYWAEQSDDLSRLYGKSLAHVMGESSIKHGGTGDRSSALVQHLQNSMD